MCDNLDLNMGDYKCADCGAVLTDANRLCCEGDECTESLCLDCAIVIGNLNTGAASVYCEPCAEEKIPLLDSSAGDRVQYSHANTLSLSEAQWTTIKERGLV